MAEKKISVSLEGRMDSLSRTLQQAESETEKHTRAMRSGFDRVDSGILSVGRSLGSLAVSAGVTAAVTALSYEVIRASLAAESLDAKMKSAAGSSDGAKREFSFIREESQKLGLDLKITAGNYADFLASVRRTPLEGEPARKVFVGVSEAVTALRLPAEKAEGVMRALTQMVSKGKVSAEELTGQLGESLPGALLLAADAMGMTTEELMKQMQAGKILAADLLPRLAEQLHNTYGKAAEDAAKGGQSGINRFNNELWLTAVAIGDVVLPAINKAANVAAEALRKTREQETTSRVKIKDGLTLAEDDKFVDDRAKAAAAKAAIASPIDPQMGYIDAGRRAQREEARAKVLGTGGGLGPTKAEKEAEATRRHAEAQRKLNEAMQVGLPAVQAFYKEQEQLADAANKQLKESIKLLEDFVDGASLEGLDRSLMPPALQIPKPSSNRPTFSLTGAEETAGFMGNSPTAAVADKTGINAELLQLEASYQAELRMLRGDSWSMERLRLDEERDYSISALISVTDTAEEQARKRALIEQIHSEKSLALKRAEEQAKLDGTMMYTSASANLFSALYELSGKKMKVFFYMQQMANAASAVMSGHKAGAAALEPFPVGLGPIYGIPLKAIMIAGGYASAAAIMAQSLSGPKGGGGGGGSSYGGGMPSSQVVNQPNYNQTPQMGNVTFIVQGNMIAEDKYVEEKLIPLFNSAGTRNVRIEYLN